ncbi:MAG: DUF427 domain-containing protein [Acidimicrobiia bacterium]|nr:DUF427 domain-containing protein [Acidimicrobiia bacterium]
MTERGRVRVESGRKRVRGIVGGEVVVDTDAPLLVWEKPYYPTYYFPADGVRTDVLVDTGETSRTPSRGTARVYSIVTEDFEIDGAVLGYDDSPIAQLNGTFRVEWGAMDHWFEEDEEVYVHPRDPYKRVDSLRSSRHVVVSIDGVEVANSTSPVILFETGLPPRYYLPKTDVRMELLVPSDTSTACPYKGTAEYWSVQVGDTVHEDIVWSYPFPARESEPIAGLVCFYNEKVDVTLDGRPLERPETLFS